MHAVSEPRCIEHILDQLSAGRGGMVVTPNVDHLRRCRRDLSFAAVVQEADLVVADGMPLVWASRLQGTPLPQRVAGSDLISSLSAAAAATGRSVFLLGGEPGTADAAAAILRDRCPQLKIAGTLCPPLGFEKDAAQLERITQALQSAQPDIVYVGLGSPKQERLIDRLRRALPRAWWLGVGVSFSFLCGDVRRAPPWMRKHGLEWLHRLGQEPKRLFKRYLVLGPPYAAMMLLRAAGRGITHRLVRSPTEVDSAVEALVAPSTGVAPATEALPADPPLVPAASPRPIQSAAASLADGRLRGLILLGGSVRSGPLTALGRNILDLPVGGGGTILTRWLDQAAQVAQLLAMDYLPIRLLVDRQSIEPSSGQAAGPARCRVERDTSDYRGTGGLLADVTLDYSDDDLILVGNAAQVLLEPLTALLLALRKTGGALSVVDHRDGTASGLMLVTCRTLRLIPSVGFVDMKEQALPAIANHHDVRVLHCRRPTGLPVRSLADYLAALRALHRPVRRAEQALAEDWKSTFAIIEPAASVAPSARVLDSVVLAGAAVEAGAVLVRCVVAPGAVVRKDRKVVDQCVTAGDKGRRNGRH